MRTTTGGLGIHNMSATRWGWALCGNKQFSEWVGDGGLKLKKVTNGPLGKTFILERSKTGSTITEGKLAGRSGKDAWFIRQPFTKGCTTLDVKFGQTAPADLVLDMAAGGFPGANAPR